MNLELLDPFRRQLPDRVDATLALATSLHKSCSKEDSSSHGKKEEEENHEWKAAYTVAFNRRGTYLAVGHASGAIATHDTLSRTLSALYRPEATDNQETGGNKEAPSPREDAGYPNGVTSLTWSRRSRTMLAGAVGDARVRLVDTTHPLGPEDCSALWSEWDASDFRPYSHYTRPFGAPVTLFTTIEPDYEFVKVARHLKTRDIHQGAPKEEPPPEKDEVEESEKPKKYGILSFTFSQPLGGSCQVHPRDVTAGLVVLEDGSLVLFRAPPTAWEAPPHDTKCPTVTTVTLWDASKQTHGMTCAAFCPRGDKIYAASKDGHLMGFEITQIMQCLQEGASDAPAVKPTFDIAIPGATTVWHLLLSRNGRSVLLNCADGALRLYSADDCWKTPQKPKVFQDVVSKVPFASCDFSPDGEYIVGGCNGADKYELHLWNATTGALMDRLTGAQVSLYCVAWHPTRSFIAVATSDGLVDLWGPRMDWKAFAPDFQALPMNVEYIEREDEFDIVDNKQDEEEDREDSDVDVVNIEPVPVFASDSEDESEVFLYNTKIINIMVRGRNMAAVGHETGTGSL